MARAGASTYGMCPVFRPSKVVQAIEAGKGGSLALSVMSIELLLSEDVSAVLR